jgi:lysine-specific demethylase 8/hypoxia-inducible factor 1-alpha inhibitor (HIF hydroxylase)
MEAIERIHISEIKPEEFAAKYRSGEGRPVVITDALDGIPPCTLEWLTAQLPAATLPARFYGKDHFKKPKAEWKKYSEILQVTPAEYAAMLVDRRAHVDNIYMAQVPIGETALGDIVRPAIRRLGTRTGLKAVIDLNLWWGPAGHTEPLHYDSGDGTLVQLHGVKRAALFPPSQTANLYPFPLRRKGIAPWISQVYLNGPDFDRFPLLKTALSHQVDVTLSAGEVLFIPANWWHEVSSISDGYICSINRFWKVAPLSRLFTNRVSPVVYGLSMAALAVLGKKAGKASREDAA